MSKNKAFWAGLIFFSLFSGNFTPFRTGPILPIFVYLSSACVIYFKRIGDFFSESRFLILIAISIFVASTISANNSIGNYGISGFEFRGAMDPQAFSRLAVIRFLACFPILAITMRMFESAPRSGVVATAILHGVLVSSLFLQAIIYGISGTEVGYIFESGWGIRYGSFFGEPQTLSAWICCTMYCSWLGRKFIGPRFGYWLIISTAGALLLTQSTAWIISFILFIIIMFGVRLYTAAFVLGLGSLLIEVVFEKIYSDLFLVSERSVTILAGAEFFLKDIYTIFFGYGGGMSAYLLPKSATFLEYPQFVLSDVGRQNIMNTFLDITFEFGLFGVCCSLYLFFISFRIKGMRDISAIIPILFGMMGIGGGYAAGYFLICAPGVLVLDRMMRFGIGDLGKPV